MSPFEIFMTLFNSSNTLFSSILLSVVSGLMSDVITKKIAVKSETWYISIMECINETQKDFAHYYHQIYNEDSSYVLGKLLKVTKIKDSDNVLLTDEIISELIHTTFDVETTEEMIQIWKQSFSRIILKDENKELLSIIKNIVDDPEKYITQNTLPRIFLSYSWKDEKIANEIDVFFEDRNISLMRDKKSIEQWGSIRSFMDSILDSDYVILIISSSYLKSINCMYEILQLMKDSHYKERIFPVVLDKSIYELSGRINYITYWEEKYEEVKKLVSKINNIENTTEVSKELCFIRNISFSISEFLSIVSDMNNPDADNISTAIYEQLKSKKII